MKCDELKSFIVRYNGRFIRAYKKTKVDNAISELKNKIQLCEDEIAGFLQLEEECGGGDLRNYIAELKQKLEDAK